MGRRVSVEGRLARGLLAAVAVGSLFGCARNSPRQVEATEVPVRVPLSCGGDRIYPENRRVVPLSGSYLIEPPAEGQYCYLQLANHRGIQAYLEIGSQVIGLKAFIPEFDTPLDTFGSIPPTKTKTLEYEFRGVWFRLSLTPEGNYLVEYRFDPARVPMPTEVPPGFIDLFPETK